MTRGQKWCFQAGYILLVFGLGIFFSEFVLRLLTPKRYLIWPPHAKRVYKPKSEWLPGISGEGRFQTNSFGLRGDELPSDAAVRILTLGGSTTEALYLDQTEAWPYLLQETLNRQQPDKRTWVGNGGKSGHNSVNHLFQMRHVPGQIPGVSTVLVLLGANEVFFQPYWKTEFNPQPDPKPLRTDWENLTASFSSFPIPVTSTYFSFRNSALFFHLDRLYWLLNKIGFYQDHQGNFHQKMRALKQSGQTYNQKPDLTLALDFYEKNLNQLVDQAHAQNLSIILMTQPYAWNPTMTEQEKKFLWWGWVYGSLGFFYPMDIQIEIFEAFNSRLLAVCSRRNIQCIDLASEVPHHFDYFYDDIHFNEKGNAQVAQVVAKHLSRPFIPPP